jgi:hypothetical protein
MIDQTKIIFSICSRCENIEHVNALYRCVNSIRKFYTDAEIVIVDSNSPSREHLIDLQTNNCFISELRNINYEAGAIWDTFKSYDKEIYVFLQDSMELLENIDDYLHSEIVVLGGIYRDWESAGVISEFSDWSRQNIINSDYIHLDSGFTIVQFNSMIINKQLLQKLKDKKLDLVLPTNKVSSCSMERVFGIALAQEGYEDLAKHQLPQNLIHKQWMNRQ